jgi:hypothetical protein
MSGFQQRAARTPLTLLAAMHAPVILLNIDLGNPPLHFAQTVA